MPLASAPCSNQSTRFLTSLKPVSQRGILIALFACVFSALVTHAGSKRVYLSEDVVAADIPSYSNKTVTVLGKVKSCTADGISGSTFIIELESGIRCRVNRNVFKPVQKYRAGRYTAGKTVTVSPKFLPASNALNISLNEKPLLGAGRSVILRGAFKFEMKKYLFVATLLGSDDEDTREAGKLKCFAPCRNLYSDGLSCSTCQ